MWLVLVLVVQVTSTSTSTINKWGKIGPSLNKIKIILFVLMGVSLTQVDKWTSDKNQKIPYTEIGLRVWLVFIISLTMFIILLNKL